VEVQLLAFLNSALRRREWPASHPGRCTRRLLFCKLFNLYGEAKKNYRLIITKFNLHFYAQFTTT